MKRADSALQRILNTLGGGILAWDELKRATQLTDERLGFVLGELLDGRKIWTAQKGEVRVYGIEKRHGLVPRFTYPLRRSTD